MNKWLAVGDETKRLTYEQIAEKTGMSAFAVEKDWWVVQTLAAVFGTAAGPALVFKGGTSLSKAWQLIERFSEDIDLAIDREFLEYPGQLSNSKILKLREKAGEYAIGTFLPNLKDVFANNGIIGIDLQVVEVEDSAQDPRIIEVYYPHVIQPPGYLAPKVQIEIGCRALREPFSNRTFGSLVDEHYPHQDFAQPHITVPVVNPERTFLEKIFLLHEEFHKPPDKIRVDRLSRHLYDVVKLSRTPIADRAFEDKELYSTIVEHRHKFTRVGGVDYNLHQPQHIDPLPTAEIMEAWHDDYNLMLERMIYEEKAPTFEEILAEMTALRTRINELPWKFEMEFAIPNPQ